MITFSPQCIWHSIFALGLRQTASLHLRHSGTARIQVSGIKHPVTVGCNRGDRGAFDQVLILRNYDHPAVRALQNPRLIIDAGAHIGMASVFFANLFPGAKIIAIEPEPGNFALLQQNIAPYKNITALQAAAWPRYATLEVSGNSWVATVRESLTSSISGIPLSSLADEVDILKMDIEGSEKQIFEAGSVPRCKLLLIETHDYIQEGCSAAVLRYLSAYPFTRFRVSDVDIFAL